MAGVYIVPLAVLGNVLGALLLRRGITRLDIPKRTLQSEFSYKLLQGISIAVPLILIVSTIVTLIYLFEEAVSW